MEVQETVKKEPVSLPSFSFFRLFNADHRAATSESVTVRAPRRLFLFSPFHVMPHRERGRRERYSLSFSSVPGPSGAGKGDLLLSSSLFSTPDAVVSTGPQ